MKKSNIKAGINLSNVNLLDMDLSNKDLNGINFRYAELRNINFSGSNLSNADFRNAVIHNTDFQGCNLVNADFSYSDLRNASFNGAYLDGASFDNAKLPSYKICPEEGSFIAYKRASGCIITVEIPAGSKRTSCLRSRKCRAEFVKVLDIRHNDEKIDLIFSNQAVKTKYKIGEITKADKFNDDIRVDYSNGIHFFVTKQEAIDW